MAIKHVCDCGSNDTDIFSVVEKDFNVKDKIIKGVEITYICNKCGTVDITPAYLYKKEN